MSTQPQKQEWQSVIRWRLHQPLFGRLSLWVLAAAAVIAVISVPIARSHPEDGLAIIGFGFWLGGIMCIVNIVISLIGLARRESPRWPAITGLSLSVLPALGLVYLLCGPR
jgi:hypothetical protein